MSLAVLILPTNKTKSTVTDHVRKIGQGEKGLTLEVIVTDANSNGYDLTDKIITFSENKVGGKIVSDSTTESFERLDDKAGRFRYKLADAVYAASGSAWFDISSKDGSVIDTTKSFDIEVIEDATIHVNNDNYVSTLTALETHYKAIIQRTEEDNQALIDKLTSQINLAIANGNDNIKKATDEVNKLIAQWTIAVNNGQQALKDLQSAWKKQTDQINTDYQAQKKAIQTDANNQLADNKKAIDAALAKLESDKQDAIAKANTDFQNKLNNIQTDYNTWKQNTITDFLAKLSKLEQELANDEAAQAELKKAIDAANAAIAKINDVDFTKYAKKEDLDKINTLANPYNIDSSVNPDSLINAGFYFAPNGFGFASSKVPSGYRANGKSYLAVLQGDNPDNSTNYFQHFLFQATKFTFECWYRAGYKYGDNAYYTVGFTNLKDIFGRLKQVSVNGGKPVSPDDKGVADITVPNPDLSGYATKADAKAAHDAINTELAKRPLSVNGKKPDQTGAIQLTDFQNPDGIFTNKDTLDIDTFLKPGIYSLQDPVIIASINKDALKDVPLNKDGKTRCGYLIITQHDMYNVSQEIRIFNWNSYTISHRFLLATNNFRPAFEKIATSTDVQNLQGQITSNAQSSMKSWSGTLAQYQALTSYDPMTMYFIVSDYEVVVK